jgi:hypothetical protein
MSKDPDERVFSYFTAVFTCPSSREPTNHKYSTNIRQHIERTPTCKTRNNFGNIKASKESSYDTHEVDAKSSDFLQANSESYGN